MFTELSLDIARRPDGAVTVTAAGEIDLSNVDALKQALAAAVESAGSDARIVVDLAAVEYVDSAVISALSACAERIDTVIVNPLLVTVFTISGLSELVTVESAPADAGQSR
ncbi:STAS domain-containing protein [Mycolicibacterium vaccae]|jgi:anti-sigma B factor antagonist|uniref:Anti-sigma-factor antagonist n=1 Tax=Mycolicibacterium vaccae ATCC 25954 TaxID=1194972 RepID=K0VAP3_MYCVA|nr:STAS domain-containing protein [Mycolicibacterium vaccae]ANI40743.1 anti-sigma-factor antagonist [Mycolicibacterium vaccae 95051]EJZ08099.1 anti-sigma-factor antagonist [Mycolicibacterium vaccae ATCC 25954]MCV7060042.1 STAS domain-containing protein [Mycolicibacterium vaccae]